MLMQLLFVPADQVNQNKCFDVENGLIQDSTVYFEGSLKVFPVEKKNVDCASGNIHEIDVLVEVWDQPLKLIASMTPLPMYDFLIVAPNSLTVPSIPLLSLQSAYRL